MSKSGASEDDMTVAVNTRPSDTLAEELDALPAEVRALLSHHHFDRTRFFELAERLSDAHADDIRDNRVRGVVTPCEASDLARLPEPGSAEEARLRALGEAALRAGQCALIVLAGGMATRMGGVVKALVEAVPGSTFLDLRLREADALAARYGARAPLWLMSSHTTDGPIREALGARLDGYDVAVFPQFLSLRLTPQGHVFKDAHGEPSVHAPGHGDLPDALGKSGLLTRFVAGGGKLVMVTNLDNLGGGLDPLIVGMHLDDERPVTCEVVDKLPGDRGGIPVRLDGRPVVLEEFRLPTSFDPESVRVFNVNTFVFDAEALQKLDIEWTYFVVHKKVDDVPVVQFERLVGEVTSALATRYLVVPRVGAASRFLPVKDHDELARRKDEIAAVARTRGMLGAEVNT
jgi:UTP--glucose-1-phosphate uridylyltransferase